MKASLGIDIAKRKHHLVLLYQEVLRRKVIINTTAGFKELLHWLEKQQAKLGFLELHVCMEATGPYYEPLAEYLSQHGYTVSVVNPARIAAFAKSKLAGGKPIQPMHRSSPNSAWSKNPSPGSPCRLKSSIYRP